MALCIGINSLIHILITRKVHTFDIIRIRWQSHSHSLDHPLDSMFQLISAAVMQPVPRKCSDPRGVVSVFAFSDSPFPESPSHPISGRAVSDTLPLRQCSADSV